MTQHHLEEKARCGVAVHMQKHWAELKRTALMDLKTSTNGVSALLWADSFFETHKQSAAFYAASAALVPSNIGFYFWLNESIKIA